MNSQFEQNLWQQKDYQNGHTYTTQVLVVGSGCGGASVAKKLSDQGIDVIILEQGGYYPASLMDQNELNMAGKLFADRGLGTAKDPGNVLMYGNNVGGASVHYWADSYRTPEEKIALWRGKYGIAGHGEEKLVPAFEEIERLLNIHPAQDEYFNAMNTKLRAVSKKLGWHGHRVPQARKFCQKSGHCMQGCVYDAKQSQMVTHIPIALKNGSRLFADAKAGSWIYQNGKVVGIHVDIMDRKRNRVSGQSFKVMFDALVVAAGGYNSSFYLMQQGLKARLPALGRFFSMNPSTMVHALYKDQEIIQWRNIPAAWGVDQFRLREYDAAGQYKQGGYLLMPNQLHPASLAATIPGVGSSHREWMSQLPYIGGTIAWIDDIESELGEICMTRSGARQVVYEYGNETRKVLLDSLEKQVLANFSAGASKVLIAGVQAINLDSVDDIHKLRQLHISSGGLFLASPHPGGGCRMGSDADTSVVDSTHRVHGLDNVFVADSSVFPTSSSLDPSLTIMAFSYIAASHIASYLGEKQMGEKRMSVN